jgi:hypothetical protein
MVKRRRRVEGWRLFMLSSIGITQLPERICRPLEN